MLESVRLDPVFSRSAGRVGCDRSVSINVYGDDQYDASGDRSRSSARPGDEYLHARPRSHADRPNDRGRERALDRRTGDCELHGSRRDNPSNISSLARTSGAPIGDQHG